MNDTNPDVYITTQSPKFSLFFTTVGSGNYAEHVQKGGKKNIQAIAFLPVL